MSNRTAPTPLPLARPPELDFPDDPIIPVVSAIPTVLPAAPRRRRPAIVEGDDLVQQFVTLVRSFARFVEWCFGFAALLVGLAILAAIPVLQFLTLGYLLESGGRLARTGRFWEAFIGIRLAARLGGIALACWLFLLPIRLLAD